MENSGASLFRAGDASGWAMSYGFLSNDKSNNWGGFGGYGVGNSVFNYWYIGQTHTTAIMYFLQNGNVGIGKINPTSKLEVNGVIKSKEVNVTTTGWADYVFEENYMLLPLLELEVYIANNGHLPNIPTEKEVLENGISLGEINVKLLEKIEEITIYMIEHQKRIVELESELRELRKTSGIK